MAQLVLPVFPEGVTLITPSTAFEKREGTIYYFHGCVPVFSHSEEDKKTFRMFVSQLVVTGVCKQIDIIKAFGIPPIQIKRAVKLYREKGPEAFYQNKKLERKRRVLTPEVLSKAQTLLDEGLSCSQVADELKIKRDTLKKAISDKRLLEREGKKKNKSERSIEDDQAEMGKGCLRVIDRVGAATGEIVEAQSQFEDLVDVENAGVLFALPALLGNGLIKHSSQFFKLPPGFYSLKHILLVLAFMALCRVKNIERLRYMSPGELGKLLGLDRVPEARTLRNKVQILSEDEGEVKKWGAALAKGWMEDEPETAGTLYIDGHVRVYNGSKVKLPKRYVARQKLALRGVSDYWVNDREGQPFFVVSSPFTEGLLSMLEKEIVPRLKTDVPDQPTAAELAVNPFINRFVLIFDREGYSPKFFKQMWKNRISCQTYNKFPGDKWSEKEFKTFKVKTRFGESVDMKLAERGIFSGKTIWLREIRKIGKKGHQTSIISSDFISSTEDIAVNMFSRWSQENFFKYMRENYNLDALVGYSLSSVDETKRVINPSYRKLEGQIKSTAAKLYRKKAKFHDIQFKAEDLSPRKMENYIKKKGEMLEEIKEMEKELAARKAIRKETEKHIPYKDLPEAEKFKRIAPARKQLLDTIKMIAYRAEISMCYILRDYVGRKDDVHSLLKEIYRSDADICPDHKNKTLTIKLHHLANTQADEAVRKLCVDLNNSEAVYPGTDYRMVYNLVSN